MTVMSKLSSFIQSSVQLVEKDRHAAQKGVRMIDGDINETSFDQILSGMEKIDPLDRNAALKAGLYAQVYMQKLRLATKDYAVIDLAEDRSNYFTFNVIDRNLRHNQIKDLSDIARPYEPDVGKPKSVFKKIFG